MSDNEPKIKTEYTVEELEAELEFKCMGCDLILSKVAESDNIIYCPVCLKPYHIDCIQLSGCQNPDCPDYANRKKVA